MRNSIGLVVSALAVALSAAPAAANNTLEILGGSNANNLAIIDFDGTGNELSISQEFTGSVGTNSIKANIVGDMNGGPAGSSFSGIVADSGLQPGNLVQIGFNNTMSVDVQGSHNLFAFTQNGNGNVLSASITGTGNQAAVLQHGSNNHANFTQNGTGNMVSIVQRSF